MYFFNLDHYILDYKNPKFFIKGKKINFNGWYVYDDLQGGNFENIGRPTIFKENFKITNKKVPLIIIYRKISL